MGAELAERLADREVAAEEEFVRSHRGRILAFLRRRVRDPEAARELTNDVLLAVLRAVGSGRLLDPHKLSAFALGIARNMASNYCRSRARRPAEYSLTPDLPAPDPGPRTDWRDRRRAVFRELLRLDETDRSILGLTLTQGMLPCEIARALKLSLNVVRTRKCRAIRRLAARLGSSTGTSAFEARIQQRPWE